MSHEDELIHFLNGFNKFSKNEVFLDENGHPTDHFLQALKTDTNIAPNTAHRKHFMPRDEDLDLLYQDTESNEYDYDGIQLENPRNAAGFRNFSKSLNNERHKISSEYRNHDHSEEDMTIEKKKPKTKKKVTKPNVTEFPLHTPKSPAVMEEVHFPKEAFDTTEIEVEAQSKIKALHLRLSGQRNTIKSLEQQLSETSEVLTARNKQLAVAHARLKALDSKMNSTKQISPAEDARLKAAEEAVDKYKKQADLMQAKFLEEQVKRQRAEEKARVLKEYADKSKNRCQSLEGQVAELNGANVELSAKMEKYRKGYKEQAADVNAHRAAINERDFEVLGHKQRVDKAESTLRNIQMELEHCREQLRVERAQHKVTQSKVKQMDIQMEILHEKEATKKAEQRLHDLEGVTQRHRNIASIQQHQNQHIQRQYEQSLYGRPEAYKDYYSDSDSQPHRLQGRPDSAPASHRQQQMAGGSGNKHYDRVRSLSPNRSQLNNSRDSPMQWVKYHQDATDEALDRDVLRLSESYEANRGGRASAGIAAAGAYDHSDRREKKRETAGTATEKMRSPSEESSGRKKPLPRYVLSSNHSVGSVRSELSSIKEAPSPAPIHAASPVMSAANFIKNKVASSSTDDVEKLPVDVVHTTLSHHSHEVEDDVSSVSSNNRSGAAHAVTVEIQNNPVRVSVQPSPGRNSESSRLQKLYNRVTAINNSSMSSN